MRKKKENIKINSDPDLPKTDALETEREERYEEIAGEMATDNVGSGFTTNPNFDASIDSADGPLAGESIEPPVSMRELSGKAKSKSRLRKTKKHEPRVRTVGRHAAARSSKKY
jgi:hypothetical protein